MVAWMDNSAAYLGRVDLDTGELLEVLNQSEVSVSPDVELIRTSDDGVALIGISDQGLVYVSESETRILDGTEGMRIGFLPKGETPGLRFTMVPEDTDPTDSGSDVYLYDNGVVSLLDFGPDGGQAISWLNESEVVVYNDSDVQVYNVDTQTFSYVGANVYEKGHSASLEASGGQRIIAVQGETGDFYDLYRDTDEGWELLRRAIPPSSEFGPYLFSPELFEWQGRMFMSGIMAEVSNTQNETVLAIYDLLNDTWSQMSPRGGEMIDPETLALNDGSLAMFFRDTLTQSSKYIIVTPDDVAAAAIPSEPAALVATAEASGREEARTAPWSGLVAEAQVAVAWSPAAGSAAGVALGDGSEAGWIAARDAVWAGLAAEAVAAVPDADAADAFVFAARPAPVPGPGKSAVVSGAFGDAFAVGFALAGLPG